MIKRHFFALVFQFLCSRESDVDGHIYQSTQWHNVTRLVLAESVPHGPGVPVEVPHRRANPAEEGSQVVWGAPHLGLHLLHPLLQPLVQHRVVKCLGYDGYIRVKISSGWGKKFGRTHNFAKSGLFLVRFVQLCKIVVHRLAQFN